MSPAPDRRRTPAERRTRAVSPAAPRPATPLGLALLASLGGGLGLLLSFGPPWPLTLAANLAHLLGLAALPIGVLSWLRGRRRRAAVAAGLVLVLALVSALRWGPRLPVLRADPSAAPRLRVMTYNLGTDLARGPELVRGLRQSGADLIALEELSAENAATLETGLRDLYPYRALHPGGIPGRGLFSRYPIVSQEWLELGQSRRHLLCRVDVRGRELSVFVLHLSMRLGFLGAASSAARDLDELAARALGQGPALLCGDFNTTERSDAWRRLSRAGFTDAFRSAGSGPGFTFPVAGRYLGIPSLRCLRIDYVWLSPELAVESARVGPDLGSDHRPVLADLRWR